MYSLRCCIGCDGRVGGRTDIVGRLPDRIFLDGSLTIITGLDALLMCLLPGIMIVSCEVKQSRRRRDEVS